MRIIGPPSATPEVVLRNIPYYAPHQRFTAEMMPALWDAGVRHLIDPVGLIAQALKETGAGRYPGIMRPEFYNTCGLKIRHVGVVPEAAGDKPLAHAMFLNWQVGAEAHVQHVRAYAGWPVTGMIVDPRYGWITGFSCQRWSDLGGKWATSASYGAEIETRMAVLTGRPA